MNCRRDGFLAVESVLRWILCVTESKRWQRCCGDEDAIDIMRSLRQTAMFGLCSAHADSKLCMNDMDFVTVSPSLGQVGDVGGGA